MYQIHYSIVGHSTREKNEENLLMTIFYAIKPVQISTKPV